MEWNNRICLSNGWISDSRRIKVCEEIKERHAQAVSGITAAQAPSELSD